MGTEIKTDEVRTMLEALRLPEAGTVWVGPYEQLQGAGFALLAATRHGVFERDMRDYHARVRSKIVALIFEHDATAQAQDKWAFDNALAGFYFNAGIQRIVWASERLIKTLSVIQCACGDPSEIDSKSENFNELMTAAKRRILHVEVKDKKPMKYTTEMLSQLPEKYKRESKFNPNFALSALRYDVNNRKHAIFGPLAQDRRSARPGATVDPELPWSHQHQNVQMQVACKAFEVVGHAYNELKDWQPSVSSRQDTCEK